MSVAAGGGSCWSIEAHKLPSGVPTRFRDPVRFRDQSKVIPITVIEITLPRDSAMQVMQLLDLHLILYGFIGVKGSQAVSNLL